MSSEAGVSLSGNYPAVLPTELNQFFSNGGRSLLVRGAAGTGKTTLALTLLLMLDATKNFLYLSTRQSPKLLYRDHPWLGERAGHAKGESPSKKDESTSASSFVDARLDEPTQLFERITSQLMDAGAPLVVVDTLDALEDFIDTKALRTNVRVLQTWCERAGVLVILTLEDPDSASLDSLMDGVVTLRQKVVGERRLRQIELVKLLGVRMSRPSHYFTLNQGWFRSFAEPSSDDFAVSPEGTIVATPRRSTSRRSHFSTGFVELDDALGGGLPVGSVTTLGVDDQTSMKVAFLLLARIITTFPGDGKVLLGPLDGLDPEFVRSYLALLPQSIQARIGGLGAGVPADYDGSEKGPILSVIAGSNLVAKTLERYAELARLGGGATIVVERGAKKRSTVPGAAGARLSVTQTGGAVLVAPDSPFSQYLGATVSNRRGVPGLELEPIV